MDYDKVRKDFELSLDVRNDDVINVQGDQAVLREREHIVARQIGTIPDYNFLVGYVHCTI